MAYASAADPPIFPYARSVGISRLYVGLVLLCWPCCCLVLALCRPWVSGLGFWTLRLRPWALKLGLWILDLAGLNAQASAALQSVASWCQNSSSVRHETHVCTFLDRSHTVPCPTVGLIIRLSGLQLLPVPKSSDLPARFILPGRLRGPHRVQRRPTVPRRHLVSRWLVLPPR